MSDFKVSVIIPIYNAEKFLRKAVESAEILEDVAEIILIEDQSPDKAFEVALTLQKEYDKVKVFQHPDKQNHGAGASRNLGITKATFDYIAFLDADDYYLPNRFIKDKEIFLASPTVDGVYNAIGIHYYSDAAKQKFFEAGYSYQEFLTLTNTVSSDQLFSVLFHAHKTIKGEFSTIAITVKRNVFDKIGYFNTQLKLQQDIHMWRRMAAFCRLESGELSIPVAVRGVHGNNRMTQTSEQKKYRDLWWRSLKSEFRKRKLAGEKQKIFEQAYFNHFTGNSNKLIALKALLFNVLKKPDVIIESYGNFDFNFWKVFGRNWLSLRLISFKNKLVSK